MKVDSEQAYVLHTRPFRENSLLVDLFTRQYGRIRVVARVSKSGKKARSLAPFSKLVVSWSGRSELKTLTRFEVDGRYLLLQGDKLFLGLYINELLCRVVAESDPHELLFERYGVLLDSLSQSRDVEPLLRLFEFALLDELGYGLNFTTEVESGAEIDPDGYYSFKPDNGFCRFSGNPDESSETVFLGVHIAKIAGQDYSDKEVKRAAKWLVRMALQPHLKGRPLHSRELFMSAK